MLILLLSTIFELFDVE